MLINALKKSKKGTCQVWCEDCSERHVLKKKKKKSGMTRDR